MSHESCKEAHADLEERIRDLQESADEDATRLATLEAKVALYAASLKQADAETGRLRTALRVCRRADSLAHATEVAHAALAQTEKP